MTKIKVQKKTINTTLEKSNNNKLSIQFTLDGFSFCITNLDSNKTIYFSDYIFDKKLESPENLVKQVESIFKKDETLQKDFKEVLVIHHNNLSSLVPNIYFDEKNLKEYLNHNIKTLATDFFAFDDLKKSESKNVYVPFVNINNYIFQHFGEFEYKHSSTLLIEKLLKKDSESKQTMYINVGSNEFSIVVLKDSKIQFYNSFTFTTKEDFIYYILFTAQQLALNTNEFPLFFMGDIQKESEIYKITYQYIRNVNFLESESSIFKNSEFSNHTNFILLG